LIELKLLIAEHQLVKFLEDSELKVG